MVDETSSSLSQAESTARQAIRFRTIEASRGLPRLDLAELWRFRGLLTLILWRDIRVRYKQTWLGLVWIVLQPLAMTIAYSIFFGYLARFPSEGVPYPIYILSALVLWQYFNRAVTDGSQSLVVWQSLISKIYFPRIIAPLAAVFGALFDLLVMVGLLLTIMAFYGRFPQLSIFFAPIYLVIAAVLALGVSLFLTSLDAMYRDVRYAVGFFVQIWYFLSPVVYPMTIVPERFRTLYLLNPLTPLLQGFRWSLLGDVTPPPLWSLALSGLTAVIVFIIGLTVFLPQQRNIADRI